LSSVVGNYTSWLSRLFGIGIVCCRWCRIIKALLRGIAVVVRRLCVRATGLGMAVW